MERSSSGNLNAAVKKLGNFTTGNKRSSEYIMHRTESQQSKKNKTSSQQQMSISISVNHMRSIEGHGANKKAIVLSSNDLKNNQVDVDEIGNVPLEIAILNKELAQNKQPAAAAALLANFEDEIIQKQQSRELTEDQTLSIEQVALMQNKSQETAASPPVKSSTQNINKAIQHEMSSVGPKTGAAAGIVIGKLESNTLASSSQRVTQELAENHSERLIGSQNRRLNSRGARMQSGVRKKRVKSTRPGVIRGTTLIEQEFTGTDTPMTTKKSKQDKWQKLARNHSQSKSQRHAASSTKAGDSSQNLRQQSTLMHKSYAPTSLVKIGAQSVQRLRFARHNPTDGRDYQSSRPITAGVGKPFLFNNQPNPFKMDYATSLSQVDVQQSEQGRPFSHLGVSASRFNQRKLNQTRASLKAMAIKTPVYNTEQNLSDDQTNEIVSSQNLPNLLPQQVHLPEYNQEIKELQYENNEVKLVSQFQNEAQATAYATELQKYYDSLNMDVKVQIEANLTTLNDDENEHSSIQTKQQQNMTDDDIVEVQEQDMRTQQIQQQQQEQLLIVAGQDVQFKNSSKSISAQKLAQSEEDKRQSNLSLQNAYSNHFNKSKKVQRRSIKCVSSLQDGKQNVTKRATGGGLTIGAQTLEYEKFTRQQIREIKKAQEQIFGVIQDKSKLPKLSYQNAGATQRNQKDPNFKLDKDIQKTQIKFQAEIQAEILQKLGVVPSDLKGEVAHASQIISHGENKIPKSMAKFYQREQKMKKIFDNQVAQWQKETTQFETTTSTIQQMSQDTTEPPFKVDVQLYKERGDEYIIIGNKLQYRASEQGQSGQNFCHKQALDTKNNFDPLRIRLRIMPISRAPLAQGKTPDYYFVEAAKKSLSGDLTSAVEMLKRGLIINPNHFICRFNHGVLMFKFGFIRYALQDFEKLTHHPHGAKDPWVFFNLATCLIQMGKPEKPMYEQEQERENREKEKADLKKKMQEESKARVFSQGRKLSLISQSSGQQSFQRMADSIPLVNQKSIDHKEHESYKGTEYYLRAIQMCDKAIDLHGNDMLILLDTLKLKGMCEYRLGRLIQSVEVLGRARRVQASIQQAIDDKRRAREKIDVDEILKYFTVKDHQAMNKKRSKSFQFFRHKKMRTPTYLKRRDKSWTNQELNEVRNKEEQLENQEVIKEESDSQNSSKHSSKKSYNEKKMGKIDTNNLGIMKSPLSASSERSRQNIKSAKKVFLKELEDEEKEEKAMNQMISMQHKTEPLFENNLPIVQSLENQHTITSDQLEPSAFSDQNKQEIESSSKATIATNIKVSENLTNRNKNQTKQLRFEISDVDQETVMSHMVKRQIIKRVQKVEKKVLKPRLNLMNDNKIEELMAKMLLQRQALAKDRKKLSYSKDQYAIFRKTYLELRKKSDNKVDGNDAVLRMKNIYLKQFDDFEEEYADCNQFEIIELKKRKEISKWIGEDDLIMQLIKEAAAKLAKMGEVGVDPVEAELNTRFVEQLLKVAEVHTEEVDGAEHEKLTDIIKDQSSMDGIMIDLREKVKEMCHQFEKELRWGMAELTASEPQLDEMKILRGERHIDVEDQRIGAEDKMVTRLRDALNGDTGTPDEVINILTQDKFEKEKLKLQLQYMNVASDDEIEDSSKHFLKRGQIAGIRKNRGQVQDMRYSERHVQMIKTQLEKPPNQRNYKVLDMMMRHLRYMKTHDKDVRQQIFKSAVFVEYPANVELFKKGDEADYMYIVLKGRICCTGSHGSYADIPLIKATIHDGEAFGEVALVNHQDFQDSNDDQETYKPKRLAACKTVEKSRMMRLVASEAKEIIQPTIKKEQEHSPITKIPSKDLASIESVNVSFEAIAPQNELQEQQTGELNQKLKFLLSFDMFKGITNKVLIPVALNLNVIKFQYGEFLTKQNERPPGMYLIKAGQCKVGLTQINTRPKTYRDIPGQRDPINDPTRMFNQFDPENSLLNHVEMQDRVFQNQRIYVENDDQIRDKIKYHDFIPFSQLFPKKQFGGRCLLPFDVYLQLKRSYFGPQALAKPDNEPTGDIKKEEQYHMKSFLDIVADSAQVEAYLITKQNLEYLSGQNLKNVYETIVQEIEPDRPYTKDKIIQKRDEKMADREQDLKICEKIMWENKIEKYGVMAVKDQK